MVPNSIGTPETKNYTLLYMPYMLGDTTLQGKAFVIQTDHHSLQYLLTQKNLNSRLARWANEAADFDFEIQYRPGRSNTAADALSRVSLNILDANGLNPEDLQEAKDGYARDDYFVTILKYLRKEEEVPASWATKIQRYTLRDNLLFYTAIIGDTDYERLCLPDISFRKNAIFDNHDAPIAGHPGFEKTYGLLARRYFWPGMAKQIKKYVFTCQPCQQNKASTQARSRLHQPLEVPKDRWQDVSMDFVTKLPKTKRSNEWVLVFVDYLTKRAHLVPMPTPVTPEAAARAYFDNVFKLHGMARSFISDRDPRFTSKFWKTLCKLVGTRSRMSTAQHPETDGQTERTNRTWEQLVRPYVTINQDNWDECLTAAEFAYNNTKHRTTGQTPFHLDTGLEPALPGSVQPNRKDNEAAYNFVTELRTNLRLAQDLIADSQDESAQRINQHRRLESYGPGQYVWVHRRVYADHLSTYRAEKLGPYYFGPFQVIESIGPTAYRIELPATSQMHPVVNVTSLKRCVFRDGVPLFESQPAYGQREQQDRLDDIEQILDTRRHRGQLEYLVTWRGADPRIPTWVPTHLMESVGHRNRLYQDYADSSNESLQTVADPDATEAEDSE